MIFKKKKGEISITILVIGVLLLCGLAMLTFFISDFRLSNSFVGISLTGEMNDVLNEYAFYVNSGMEKNTAKGFFSDNLLSENSVDYLYFEKKDYGFFNRNEGDLLFSVKYPLGN